MTPQEPPVVDRNDGVAQCYTNSRTNVTFTGLDAITLEEEKEIQNVNGVAPKTTFQFAPEEGSEGLLGPAEVRCRCLEES